MITRSMFFRKVYSYAVVLFNHHALALFATSDLKEAGFLFLISTEYHANTKTKSSKIELSNIIPRMRMRMSRKYKLT